MEGSSTALRVLVVDSKTPSRQHIVTLLQACNYKVTSCRTGRECVQLLSETPPQISHPAAPPADPGGAPTSQQDRPGFDLVLKDHEPPLVDACRLLRRLSRDANLRSIPVVVMSRQDDRDTVMRCLQLGAIDYLIKPLRRNELLNIWTRVWWRRMLTGLASSSAGGPSSNQQTSLPFPGLPDGITYSTDSKETYCLEDHDPVSKEGSAPVGNGHQGSRELEVKTHHGSNNGNGSGQENGNSGSKNGNGNGNGCSTSRNAVAGSGNAPADAAQRAAHAAAYLDPLHGSDQGQLTNNGHGSNQGVEGGGSGGGGGSGEGENENGNGSGNGGTGNSTVQSQQKEGAQGGQEVSEVPTSRPPTGLKGDQGAQGDYRPNNLQSNGRSSGNGNGQLSGNKRSHADLGPHQGTPARAEKAPRHGRPPLADEPHTKNGSTTPQNTALPLAPRPSIADPPAAKVKSGLPRAPPGQDGVPQPQAPSMCTVPVSSNAMLPHGMSGGSGTASATPMFWPGPQAGVPPAATPSAMPPAMQQADAAAQNMFQQQQLQHMQQLQLQQQQGEQQAAAAAAAQVAAAQQAAAQRGGNPFLLYRPPLMPGLPPPWQSWDQQRMAEQQRWLQRSYAAAQADSRSHSDGTAVHAAAAAAAAQMQEQQRHQMQQGYPPAGYPYAAFMQFGMGMASLGMWPPPWGPGNPYGSASSEPALGPPGAKVSHNGAVESPQPVQGVARLATSGRESNRDETTSKKAGSTRTAVGVDNPCGVLNPCMGPSNPLKAQERRAQALSKFKEKKRNLNYGKKIRYETRKQLAEARPRVKGQFVKRAQPAADADTATNALTGGTLAGDTQGSGGTVGTLGTAGVPVGAALLHGPSKLKPKMGSHEQEAVAALRVLHSGAEEVYEDEMDDEPDDDDEELDAEAREVERQEGPWEGPQGHPMAALLVGRHPEGPPSEPVAPAAPPHEDGAVWQYDDRRDDQAETAAPREGTDEAAGKDMTVSKCLARSVQGSVGVGFAVQAGPPGASTGPLPPHVLQHPASISYGVDSNHAGQHEVHVDDAHGDNGDTKSALADGSNGRRHGSDSGSNSPDRGMPEAV